MKDFKSGSLKTLKTISHYKLQLTKAFVESDQGHRQLVAFVDDRVVSMLGHPAFGRAVHRGYKGPDLSKKNTNFSKKILKLAQFCS